MSFIIISIFWKSKNCATWSIGWRENGRTMIRRNHLRKVSWIWVRVTCINKPTVAWSAIWWIEIGMKKVGIIVGPSDSTRLRHSLRELRRKIIVSWTILIWNVFFFDIHLSCWDGIRNTWCELRWIWLTRFSLKMRSILMRCHLRSISTNLSFILSCLRSHGHFLLLDCPIMFVERPEFIPPSS